MPGKGVVGRLMLWYHGLTYLLLVVQALVVVFKHGLAFRSTAVVFGCGVCDVACKHFLPEWKAARGA